MAQNRLTITKEKGREDLLTDKPNKTCWHCLLARALKELLNPVGIQVLTEVQVVPDPPRADIILLRKEGHDQNLLGNTGGDSWHNIEIMA